MRTKDEIKKEWDSQPNGVEQMKVGIRNILEVCLDIRDLLQNQPRETVGYEGNGKYKTGTIVSIAGMPKK